MQTAKTSDWADAQAELSLRWMHRSFCWFCHVVAHLFFLDFDDKKLQAQIAVVDSLVLVFSRWDFLLIVFVQVPQFWPCFFTYFEQGEQNRTIMAV